MRNDKIVSIGFLIFICLAFNSFSQDEQKPWEKYGLSQTEWKMIQDNKISLDKVQALLSTGISIGEYIKKPWMELGLTESEWIKKRRAGLTTYDIELEMKTNHPGGKDVAKNNSSPEINAISSNKNQLMSFVLPGYQQLRLKEMSRGRIMAGLGIASLAGCIIGSAIKRDFEARPLYFVLVPDMFWSFIDFKITLGGINK